MGREQTLKEKKYGTVIDPITVVSLPIEKPPVQTPQNFVKVGKGQNVFGIGGRVKMFLALEEGILMIPLRLKLSEFILPVHTKLKLKKTFLVLLNRHGVIFLGKMFLQIWQSLCKFQNQHLQLEMAMELRINVKNVTHGMWDVN